MERLIRIHPDDNVAVILVDNDPIAPRGHKIALRDIAQGENIIKYGFPIGHATHPIKEGEWVHSQNLATNLGENLEYTYCPSESAINLEAKECKLTFNGYVRKNGDVGIRNELWIIPTVGCVNSQANLIATRLRNELSANNIDDIRVFSHNYGCSQLGDDLANTRAALAALAMHPNAGGVLVLGLGCENNQISKLKEEMNSYDPDRVRFLTAQEVDDEVSAGFEICSQLISNMSHDKRTVVPISKLRIGLKCGGSDGFSGITANPLLGRLSDKLVTCGATTILTEVPEMFGAETILMNRAIDKTIFNRTVELINNFKDYFRRADQPIYENPSPGNKAGGITTLEEKSLGCVQKGGSAHVTDVLAYAQKSKQSGLNLLNAPGNDLVASTALALSGCHMVLFTTGRGTPFGTAVPTLKISTNTQLANSKRHWIDFDAGRLLSGLSRDKATDELMQLIIATANGAKAKNELASAKEIAIFKTGVTL
ncbi:MAG: altronate dehydratase family protein [Muribaculum sp.]|nr:altronate dehydratase family protein [Muribaculaceae bacterium]MCM1081285.1 altronate dehydratase family protein [Muribaculum sp.]